MRAFVALFALGLAGVPAFAEPVPLPKVEYAAKGTLSGRGTFSVRHQGGKLRMDLGVPGAQGTVVGIVDLLRRKALMMMPVPGLKMAMEVDIGPDGSFGQALGDGKKTGTSKVAGETCDIWDIAVPQAEGPVKSCITADGIGLRTNAMLDGKLQTVMEITELSRNAQDPKHFALPSDVQVVKAPNDLKGLLGAVGGRR